ncbi:MAG: glutathione S-transferase family protein [Candidatus Omnitrophica bacterium]|nr:glutathione S-transferase family protein [Candidatus Omnitrophota bacterium]MCB9747089.1 glutathione S-transferase family protein [Candidatus Omnitrophota bacterium]
MLKIYGADLSTPAIKVRLAANYMNLDYEYVRVSIRDGENKKEDFLKLHPAGKIPVIDDEGFVLFESNAIVKYLATKHEADCYSKQLREQAIIDQWIDFISLHINMAMNRVVFNQLFAPLAKKVVDERSLQDGLNFLDKFLPIMEQQLQENEFVCGSTFSIADIVLLAALDPCEAARVDLKDYKSIVKWREILRKKDFYQRCHKEYGESLKKILNKTA